MGSKTGLLVYADGDVREALRRAGAADFDRTVGMLRRLHPGRQIEECEGSALSGGVCPPEGTTYAAGWPGVDVVADRRVMIDAPPSFPTTWWRQAPADGSSCTPCTASSTDWPSPCGRTDVSSVP